MGQNIAAFGDLRPQLRYPGRDVLCLQYFKALHYNAELLSCARIMGSQGMQDR